MKHFSAALILTTLVLAAGLPSIPHAQTPRKPVRLTPDTREFDLNSQIAEAMRYLSIDPPRALEILRKLDRQYPGRDRVLSRMGYVQQVMGDADSAEVSYKRALEVNPAGLEAGKALGILYISSNREREATATFDALLRANNHDMNAYRTVGTALREVGRYDQALDVYRKGRDQSPRHYQLSLEIADILETQGDAAGAMDEYLHYVGDEGRNYRYSKTRILDLMRGADETTQNKLAALLESRIESGEGNRFAMLDILSTYYVEAGLLEKSLEKALLADQEGPSDGSVLIALSERIVEQAKVRPRDQRRRYLDLGVRALDAFATNHPRAAGTDRAKYMLAGIYVQFGSGAVDGLTTADRVNYLEQAVAEYTDLSKRYPNSEYAERAYIDRGDLLMHRLKRPEDALEAYRSGSVNSRRYGEQFASRIGDLYLGLGRREEATHYFESLINSGIPNLAQAGTYYTGLRLAMDGKFEAARDTLTYLAEEVPSSPYTNDAIESAWVIQEALQFQSDQLGTWFDASRAEMVGDTAGVVSGLEKIVARPRSEPLRPRALFKLGRTLFESRQLDGSVAALTRYLDEYPDDDQRPDVQRELAAIYETGYEQYDRALHEYESVLMNYPDYAFLDEVREDVRRLRSIVHPEENEN